LGQVTSEFDELAERKSTPMALESLKKPSIRNAALATMPMQKIARPEDVTGTIAYLASYNLSGHVSGEIITVYHPTHDPCLTSRAGGMEGRLQHLPLEWT